MSTWRNSIVTAEKPYRVAIVTARFNSEYTTRLLQNAREGLLACGIKEHHIEEFFVPGSFELPFACRQAIKSEQFDGVIAVGVVLRGATIHFDLVAEQAAAGIMQANLLGDIPVVFGVLACDTAAQIEERIELGESFAFTCVEMMNLSRSLPVKAKKTSPVADLRLL